MATGPSIRIQVTRLAHGAGLDLPAYATKASSGMDLRAALEEPLTLASLERQAVPTGLAIAVPVGLEAQIRPRSGLALKAGLTVANAPGTVDADYRGEVKVILVNLGADPVTIQPGDRIAQMVIAPVARAAWEEVDELPTTDRGAGGFGHTGT